MALEDWFACRGCPVDDGGHANDPDGVPVLFPV
jgi:hypothetical protein